MDTLATVLEKLVGRLADLEEETGEFGDSEVEERMTDAIHMAFFKPTSGFAIPNDFGLSADTNQAVRQALVDYVAEASPLAAQMGLGFQGRVTAFQNLDVVVGVQRTDYNDFFRYTRLDQYTPDGNLL